MAIVYSYQQETQPTFGDLLLGTDVSASGKPTKSFSIQSIVDLVQTGVPGGGTVTSIDTTATTFISLIGGNITTTGSLSASLSATGTPSASNYLRGDNTWAAVPAAANTTYTINSVQAGLNNNIRLNGSDSSQTIVSLLAGPNIALTNNGSNAITIGVTGLPVGTVTSVTADGGLYIVSGSATVDPLIAVDLTGLNNYIKISQSQTTAISDDFIAFNQNASENVRTTTLGTIQPSALTAVKSYIDAGDIGDIRNDTDTFTSTGAVQQVVSLSGPEYAALVTKNANTLYVVVAASSQYMTTLAFTNNISGTEYTIGGDQVGTTKMGIAGASYAYSTSITPDAGFFFSSGPTVTNATGTFSVDETVYTILAGTVEAIVVPPVTATLSISNTITGGSAGTAYTIGGDLNNATQSGASPLAYAFNTTVTPIAGYEFVTGPSISNASGTLTGDQTVVTSISGAVQAVAPPPCVATLSVDTSGISGGQFTLSGDQTGATQSGNCPLSYSFTTGITADTNYYFSSGPTITNASGSISGSQTVFTYITGTLALQTSNAIVELVVDDQIIGSSAGYSLNGNTAGDQLSGPIPFIYSFNTGVTAASGYTFTAGPNVINAQGQTSIAGLQYETTTITGTVEAFPTPVGATLFVNTTNISGPSVWSISGDQSGAFQEGTAPYTYSFSTGVTLQGGYEWSVGPTISPDPNTGTISANTGVTTTISGTIIQSVVQGTVNLSFTDNITGSADATFQLTPGTSITANVGDPYSFVHSVAANSGFEFTSGPTWSPSATISGTMTSGTTTVNQSVTGIVQAIATNCTQFLTSLNGEASSSASCSVADNGSRRRHNGSGTYPAIGDVIFTTSSCNVTFNGGNSWWYVGGDLASIQIGTNGLVLDKAAC